MVDPLKILSARGTKTQRQFAFELGVDQVIVSRWERGESQPGLESLMKLARAADKPIEWFLMEGADVR
jgi:transcriptional regulator with XRE-family HTH domain